MLLVGKSSTQRDMIASLLVIGALRSASGLEHTTCHGYHYRCVEFRLDEMCTKFNTTCGDMVDEIHRYGHNCDWLGFHNSCPYCSVLRRKLCPHEESMRGPEIRKPSPGFESLEDLNSHVTWTTVNQSGFFNHVDIGIYGLIPVNSRSRFEYVREKRSEANTLLSQRLQRATPRSACDETVYHDADIMLSEAQADQLLNSCHEHSPSRRVRRKVDTRNGVWNLPIPYIFDKAAASHEPTVDVMMKAIQFWEQHTCVRFKKMTMREMSSDFIVIDKQPGCASYVGKMGGVQPLHMGTNCERFGVAVHELGHVLGLEHEHARPDRDDFVMIDWNNVDDRKLINFQMCKDCDTKGIPYDYGSAMHYHSKSCSWNNKWTLLPFNEKFTSTIGGRLHGPSFFDILAVNKLYCEGRCPTTNYCDNGGYPNPGQCSKCLCPEPFEGVRCEQVKQGTPEPCGGKFRSSVHWQQIWSPRYPRKALDGQECTWLIEAPHGRVQVQFMGPVFQFVASQIPLCYGNFVELRYLQNMSYTGPRYCGENLPDNVFESSGSQFVVLLRDFDPEILSGFRARYRGVWDTQSCFETATTNTKPRLPPYRILTSVHKVETCKQYCFDDYDCHAITHHDATCNLYNSTCGLSCPTEIASGYNYFRNRCKEL